MEDLGACQGTYEPLVVDDWGRVGESIGPSLVEDDWSCVREYISPWSTMTGGV